jgi:NadR type nicotinamide-nucleotide adenylyltransferase
METVPHDPAGPGLIRVVLTGSESTGKTTLAAELARHYDAELVPEFVRAFAEQKGGALRFIDHGPIARGQMAVEDEHLAAARGARRVVVFDTDLLSTAIYCNHYFGRCPQWIEEAARGRRPDLYLLCETDAPWIADGVRDRADQREEMQTLFREAVLASGAPHVSLRGGVSERLARSIRAIDSILRSNA